MHVNLIERKVVKELDRDWQDWGDIGPTASTGTTPYGCAKKRESRWSINQYWPAERRQLCAFWLE